MPDDGDAPRLIARLVSVDPAVNGYDNVQDALDNPAAGSELVNGSATATLNSDGSFDFPGAFATVPPDSHSITGSFGQVAAGTPLQNTLAFDVLVSGAIQVTAATAGVLNLGVGPTATPTVDPIVGAITTAALVIVPFTAVVPAGYYLSITETGTITATIAVSVVTPL